MMEIGLDSFYEGNKKVGFYQSLIGVLHFFALSFLNVQVMNILRVWKIIQILPLTQIVLPLLAGPYDGSLIIKKALRLAKQFKNAE